jgi:CheY-like chemotaxis protein
MVDDAVKIIDAFSRFFAGIGWPLVCVVAVLWLAPALRDLITRIDTFSGEGAGIKFNITAQQRDAANQIVAAKIDQSKAQNTAPQTSVAVARQYDALLKDALETTSKIQVAHTAGKRLLWVDDNQANNIYEKQSLTALGIAVTGATSTDEALGLLKNQRFDVIISDMARKEGTTAGYDLLSKIKDAGIAAPLIFYTASANENFIRDAKQRGAYGETNSPNQLVSLVTSALGAN